MAEYRGTVGSKVRNYTTNPDNPIEGQVWYNTTDNVLKFQYPNLNSAGTWRTQANMNTARKDGGGFGSYNSAILGGGGSYSTDVESWNGSAWTEVNNLNLGRVLLAGAGADNTAGIVFGGFTFPPSLHRAETESWNGTSWTEVNDFEHCKI